MADKVKGDIATGRDEPVPASIVNRIIAGENAVKVWRMHRVCPRAIWLQQPN
ncbi:hypothetical protein [Mesorhizobium metallidurans]|uniref:hypothetical protein n=1 Tax=Mesorhizobium metallidurans TaxID=489722 RepID=UPI001FCA7AF4|nr:hypothetical protein [Mesorhizobium metallidurans]